MIKKWIVKWVLNAIKEDAERRVSVFLDEDRFIAEEGFYSDLVKIVQNVADVAARNILEERISDIIDGLFNERKVRILDNTIKLETNLKRQIDAICMKIIDARQHEWYKREEFLDEVVRRIKNKQVRSGWGI